MRHHLTQMHVWNTNTLRVINYNQRKSKKVVPEGERDNSDDNALDNLLANLKALQGYRAPIFFDESEGYRSISDLTTKSF